MASVKNEALREIIIDSYLQSGKGYSTQEIFDKCNEALERRGEESITTLNTIHNDIMVIKNKYLPVEKHVRVGRNI